MTVQLPGIRARTINFSSSHSYWQHEVFVYELNSFDKQLIIYVGVNISHVCEPLLQNSIGMMISG